ncbi:hypothetical protein GCM10008904_32900 [Paraclostridium ghonii]|uniref:Uncharacterized protein n=1 Tax=Paraclostridium ghonii TaxID=29358 RepID=A0ABU0N491_9FIRM|nr:hypothetical protein [Paeniclostridium ghonii]MDQ0557982.1 hypothetical protein [Paeniclostridium ghonii]
MKIIDTSITLAMECSDLKNLTFLENGESRLIEKIQATNEVSPSIVVIDFNKRHTQHLVNSKLNQQVMFVEGYYQVLKNKNSTPFLNIKAVKITLKNKKQVVDITNIRHKIRNDFEENDLNSLKEKYIQSCSEEEIKNLKEVIEKRDLLKLQYQLKFQETQKLKHEKKILMLKKHVGQTSLSNGS